MDLSEVTRFENNSPARALAALIREGAAIRPQCRGRLYRRKVMTAQVGSCAIGAALEAKFGRMIDWEDCDFELKERIGAALGIPGNVIDGIARANDGGATREAIATGLEYGAYDFFFQHREFAHA